MREPRLQADAVIDMAKRLDDWPLLERAIDSKLDDQEDFVNWWRENVGKGRPKSITERQYFSVDQALEMTGITAPQVSKWAKRLAKRDEYRAALYHLRLTIVRGKCSANKSKLGGASEFTPYALSMVINRLFPIVCAALYTAGCAMSSGVLKTGPGTYTISVHAAPARGGIAGAKRIAYTKANAECDRQGKQILTVSEETGHDWPEAGRADVTFRCVNKDDPAINAGSE